MRDMFAFARGILLESAKDEIKRGKTWIHGYYCQMQETTYAFEEDYKRFPVKTFHMIAQDSMTDWGLPNKLRLYEVDPETVDMYTGKTDMNARRIFEGDILKIPSTGEIVSVWWDESKCGFVCRGGEMSPVQIGNVCYRAEVIGNIFDNPELWREVC